MKRLNIICRVLLVLLASGAASRYDPGVFEMVAINRKLAPWGGAHIAMLDCSLVGSKVLVCFEEECVYAQVTDCAGIADGGRDWMIRGGYAGELDYETAISWGAVGKQISVYKLETQFRKYKAE